MRSRYRIHNPDGAYFLTATIIEWLPVFTRPRECEIITSALAYCRANKSLRIYAYVLMENHLHLVAAAPDLVNTIRAFKRHTARQLLAATQETGRDWLLNQFEYYKKRHKTTSTYQVWQEGVHPQLLQNDVMIEQKIDYIHQNPTRRGWVDAPEHWRYSSARNYLLNDHSVLQIDGLIA